MYQYYAVKRKRQIHYRHDRNDKRAYQKKIILNIANKTMQTSYSKLRIKKLLPQNNIVPSG